MIGKCVDVRTSILACYAIDARVMLSGQYTQIHVTTKYSNNYSLSESLSAIQHIFLNTPYYPWYDSTTSSSYISINQSINTIKVHHATEALGHNIVQNSTMTT